MRGAARYLAVHPLLLAAYFVLFLYAENLALVRPVEVVAPLAWALAGSAATLVVAAILLRDPGRGALVASALVVAFLGFGHAEGLADERVGRDVLLAGWALFLGGALALALYRRTPVASLTGGLNVLGLLLVGFSLSSILPHVLQAPARASTEGLRPSGLTATRSTDRDIYYLVFDRYGSQSALEAGFGITDNDLPDWLAQRGFEVLPEARANYSRTILSLASVLNLEHLHGLTQGVSRQSTDHGPVHRLLDDHLVGRFLREHGYRYVHLGSWFNPTREISVADEVLVQETATEFEAVLFETTAMPLILEHVADPGQVMPPNDAAHYENARFQFRALHRVAADPGPKLVIAHVLLPHEPYVFDADGSYISRAARADDPVELQYRRQLEYTNREIRAFVDRLMSGPEAQRPIIIISADEGPYPERYAADPHGFDWSIGTGQELRAKFGIINALYLPDEPGLPADAPEPYGSMSAVNTFRLVLGRYFGVDLPMLDDRSYTSHSPTLVYDLTDVTDRILEE